MSPAATMTVSPKTPKDLLLAPLAAEIDLNLQRLRDIPAARVEAQLELELDRPALCATRAERAELVLRQALRYVELHGWEVGITDDSARLHLHGGSVTLDLGLGAGVTDYIEHGVA